jgi:hypothetical protein
MAIKVFAGITLRRGDDIHFGTLVRLERAMAGVTTDGVLRVGNFVEFQLELTGWDQSVMGIAEVRRADIRSRRLNRFLLRILEMRRTDRRNLQAWYQEQQAEAQAQVERQASPRALDSEVGSHVPSRVQRDLPPARKPRAPGSAWNTGSALSISHSVEHQGNRRQALRAVLRAAYGDPLPTGGSAGAEATGPEVRVRTTTHPLVVELRYPDELALQTDWEAWLNQGLAFVKHTRHKPALEQPALVRLRYADRVDISCPGRVVVLHATGFGLALDPDPHQLEGLRRVATCEQPTMAEVAARAAGFDPAHEATSPLGRAFWARLFGLDASADPLEAAVGDLVDPLAPLDMDDPRSRRELDKVLGRADEDYLVLCDQVGQLLAATPWRWPALEDLTREASDPMAKAAAYVVLAHVTRLEAVDALRKAAAQAQSVPCQVEVGPGLGRSCPHCRELHGDPTTPAALTRRGLPPFHLGCQCRVVRVFHDQPMA